MQKYILLQKNIFLKLDIFKIFVFFFIDIEELLKNLKEGTLDPLDVLQAFQVDTFNSYYIQNRAGTTDLISVFQIIPSGDVS